MSLEINITDNFQEIAEAFKTIQIKEVRAATWRAINRSLITIRSDSLKMISKQIRIKEKTLRQDHIKLKKAKGGSLGTIQGSIIFSGRPIPLIHFVRGNKTPQSQKGIPIKRRRKLRVEITPGKRIVLKRAFIQTVQTTQVFRRVKSGKFKKQGIHSIAHMIRNKDIGKQLVQRGTETFRKVWLHEMRVRMSGVVKTYSRGSK